MPSAPRSRARSITAGSSVTRLAVASWLDPGRAARAIDGVDGPGARPRRRSTTTSRVAGAQQQPVGVGRARDERAAQVGGHHAGAGDRGAAPPPSPSPRSGAGARRGPPPRGSARGTSRRARARRRPRARGATSTPMASRLSHTPRSSSPGGASQAARTTAGVASLASSSRTASRNATWSSDSANLIAGAPGRARRRCSAGSRWCRRRSGRTARTASPCSTVPRARRRGRAGRGRSGAARRRARSTRAW